MEAKLQRMIENSKWYFCKRCGRAHKKTSGIGQRHKNLAFYIE